MDGSVGGYIVGALGGAVGVWKTFFERGDRHGDEAIKIAAQARSAEVQAQADVRVAEINRMTTWETKLLDDISALRSEVKELRDEAKGLRAAVESGRAERDRLSSELESSRAENERIYHAVEQCMTKMDALFSNRSGEPLSDQAFDEVASELLDMLEVRKRKAGTLNGTTAK